MTKEKNMMRYFVVACVLGLFLGGVVRADVIFYESFNGDGTGGLNGTTTDIGGATWEATVNFLSDGSLTTGSGSATFNFTPVQGKVYELTATINLANNDASWAGVGFADEGANWTPGSFTTPLHNFYRFTDFTNGYVTGYSWMYTAPTSGQTGRDYTTNLTDDPGYTDVLGVDKNINMSVVLDTTDPNWQTSYYVGDVLLTSYTNVGTDPVDAVGFTSTLGAVGTLKHFLLAEIGQGGAVTPSPANRVVDVPTTTSTLSWNNGSAANITGYNLYFAAGDPGFAGVTPISVTDTVNPIEAAMPGSLATDTTYFWRVDTITTSGTLPGSIWLFETEVSTPVITGQPVDQVVFVNGTASFTVTVDSLSAVTYAWFKSADDVVGGDTSVGSNAATLNITNAQASNEGYYYCKVTNADTGEAGAQYSDMATLGIKRKVAHWTLNQADFNGTLYLDSSGESRHADPNGTPGTEVFVPGKINEALDLTSGDPNIAAFAGAQSPTEFTGEMTISVWVKFAGVNAGETWQGILSKRAGLDTVGANEWFLQINTTGTNMSFVNGTTAQNVLAAAPAVGEWVHVAVAVDAVNGAVLYSNGLFGASNATFAVKPPSDAQLLLGALIVTETGSIKESGVFNGVIDDIQIYNYAMTQEEIIDNIYYPVTGQAVCSEFTGQEYDFVPDCEINLQDFAAFISAWMYSGVYPN